MITRLIIPAGQTTGKTKISASTPEWSYNQFTLAAISVTLPNPMPPVGSRHTSLAVKHNLINSTNLSILSWSDTSLVVNAGIYINTLGTKYKVVESFAHDLHYEYPEYQGQILNYAFSIEYWIDYSITIDFPALTFITSNRNIPSPLDARGNNSINILSSRTRDSRFAIPFDIPIIFTQVIL